MGLNSILSCSPQARTQHPCFLNKAHSLHSVVIIPLWPYRHCTKEADKTVKLLPIGDRLHYLANCGIAVAVQMLLPSPNSHHTYVQMLHSRPRGKSLRSTCCREALRKPLRAGPQTQAATNSSCRAQGGNNCDHLGVGAKPSVPAILWQVSPEAALSTPLPSHGRKAQNPC
jgi:hypothetical protein